MRESFPIVDGRPTNGRILEPAGIISWGGFSLTLASVYGMSTALRWDDQWDYFINLSTADFPILTQAGGAGPGVGTESFLVVCPVRCLDRLLSSTAVGDGCIPGAPVGCSPPRATGRWRRRGGRYYVARRYEGGLGGWCAVLAWGAGPRSSSHSALVPIRGGFRLPSGSTRQDGSVNEGGL